MKIENLTVGYKRKKEPDTILLKDINLTINKGQLICLIGPNGCGKSTFLRTITGIQSPLAGDIKINGKSISDLDRSELARSLSIVLTENFNLGSASVYSIVSMGRYPHNNWLGVLREEDFNIVDSVLDITGLTKYRDKDILELSDGFRQKVMIARALAQKTPLILLDEPTAFLDIPNKLEILSLLKKLTIDEGISILLSTHDLDLAVQFTDLIWFITEENSIDIETPETISKNEKFLKSFSANGFNYDPERSIFRNFKK